MKTNLLWKDIEMEEDKEDKMPCSYCGEDHEECDEWIEEEAA
jgi:hypothetical protein